jgi:hypothetical protein
MCAGSGMHSEVSKRIEVGQLIAAQLHTHFDRKGNGWG